MKTAPATARLFRLFLPALLGLLLSFPLRAATPKVAVTIKPVHSLVAGVMQGVGEPGLLIRGAQSPHDFNLRPSDMRMLKEADLLIWVGPDVESTLARLFEKSSFEAETEQLTLLPGLALLPPRDSAEWEARRNKAPIDHEHAGHHHHDGVDSHIWLSPVVAQLIVSRVEVILRGMDPGHAEQYRANSARLIERLQRLDDELAAGLASVRDRPFVVFHDAYHYFDSHYGLNAVGSVSLSPERQPGARHLHELRAKIERLHARCVFSEPQFRPKLVENLIEGTSARAGRLDPLGSDLEPGPDAYFQLLRNLSSDLLACLQ